MVKNCVLGLENAALDLNVLGQHFSRPRSQFFTIRTSKPANNISNIRDSDALFPKGRTII